MYTPTSNQYSGMFTWFGDHINIHTNNTHCWDHYFCNPRNSCWNNTFKTLIPISTLPATMIFFAGICILHMFKVALQCFLHSVAKNMIMDMVDYIISFQVTLSFYICIKSVKVYFGNISFSSYYLVNIFWQFLSYSIGWRKMASQLNQQNENST